MAEKMGILGRKLGMTRIFAGDGSAVAVTLFRLVLALLPRSRPLKRTATTLCRSPSKKPRKSM